MFSEQNLRQTGIIVVCGFVLSGLIFGSSVFASRAQDRPRSTQTPAATPTPPPATTPVKPASTPVPSPAPQTQRPQTDRIAPTLGEPPPPPKLKPTPTPTPPEVLDPDSVITINSELVQLHVRVIDRNNKPIGNVAKGEFHIYEDGVPQTIESFTREEVPISYGLAVDTSASLRSQIQSVIDAGKTIVNSNKPGDKTFLVRFISSDKIQTEQDFTDKKDLLMDALDNLYVEGGQTAVIDAVYLSAEHVAEYRENNDDTDRRRRALIVITDGEDRSSFYKQEQLFSRLREEDVQIYVIGFVNELDKEAGFIRKSPREKAVALINKLASETGGRAFFPESISELPQIANEIVRDMRTQYVIAYNPTNKAQDGSYRAIKVTVDQPSDSEKRIALTRTGRLARKEIGPGVRPPTVRMPPASTPIKKP